MVRPGQLVYLSQAHHQQMRDADSCLLPGAHYNPPQPSFSKGGRSSPLFFKEGAGEIFAGLYHITFFANRISLSNISESHWSNQWLTYL
jgi:hypothetical protein